MKKIVNLIVAFVIVAMTSCSKRVEVKELVQTTDVVLGLQMVQSGSMTKATNQEVITFLENYVPTNVELKLKSGTDTYTVQLGKPTTLPIGSYTVTGKYKPLSQSSVIGSDVYISTIPSISISDEITITPTQSNYVVNATYSCFAIVVELTETASATFVSSHGEQGTIEFAKSGTLGTIFITGNLDPHYVSVTLNPVSSDNEVTTFTFKSTYSADAIYAERGKYYLLHPNEITAIDEGYINWNLASWIEGTVNQ